MFVHNDQFQFEISKWQENKDFMKYKRKQRNKPAVTIQKERNVFDVKKVNNLLELELKQNRLLKLLGLKLSDGGLKVMEQLKDIEKRIVDLKSIQKRNSLVAKNEFLNSIETTSM